MDLTKTADDGLTRETWSYAIDPNGSGGPDGVLRVLLTAYVRKAWPTKRHAFRIAASWGLGRSSREDRGERPTAPLGYPSDDEVKAEMVKRVRVEVARWK